MSEVTWPGVQVPGGHHYQQQPDLSHQFGGLSLQDPAFLQELQRIETQKQFGGQQQHVPDVYMAGPGQAGLVPGPATMGSLPTVPMGGGSTGTDRERRRESYKLIQYPESSVLSNPAAINCRVFNGTMCGEL